MLWTDIELAPVVLEYIGDEQLATGDMATFLFVTVKSPPPFAFDTAIALSAFSSSLPSMLLRRGGGGGGFFFGRVSEPKP